jgi:hypothetical protein
VPLVRGHDVIVSLVRVPPVIDLVSNSDDEDSNGADSSDGTSGSSSSSDGPADNQADGGLRDQVRVRGRDQGRV